MNSHKEAKGQEFVAEGCRGACTIRDTLHASRFTRKAFTLIELLAVIVVLGILFGLLTAAISRARENAKSARLGSDTNTLGAAIWAYRHEYGKWPCAGVQTVSFSNNNYLVRQYMEEMGPEYNPHGIRFVNWSEYSTNSIGTVLNPWGTPYVITIAPSNDTVTVQ